MLFDWSEKNKIFTLFSSSALHIVIMYTLDDVSRVRKACTKKVHHIIRHLIFSLHVQDPIFWDALHI